MTAVTLGPYQLLGELGRGGMGVVYKAYDTELRRFVALKTLFGAFAHDSSIAERFLFEARAMAGIADSHVVSIYASGEADDHPYFVMELIDGETLGSVLRREGALSPENALRVVYQAALGLGAAHAKRLVHRDVKPGNLLLTQGGSIKVSDFGIARSAVSSERQLTLTGDMVGTPGYLSPESCTGKPVDARSDVFSLGVVLFECLVGRVPFTDSSPLGLMLNVVQTDIPAVRTLNAHVDEALEAILLKMVSKKPEDRYSDGLAVARALAALPGAVCLAPLELQIKINPARPMATRRVADSIPPGGSVGHRPNQRTVYPKVLTEEKTRARRGGTMGGAEGAAQAASRPWRWVVILILVLAAAAAALWPYGH
jgi:serine/threonine-protein kinase